MFAQLCEKNKIILSLTDRLQLLVLLTHKSERPREVDDKVVVSLHFRLPDEVLSSGLFESCAQLTVPSTLSRQLF